VQGMAIPVGIANVGNSADSFERPFLAGKNFLSRPWTLNDAAGEKKPGLAGARGLSG